MSAVCSAFMGAVLLLLIQYANLVFWDGNDHESLQNKCTNHVSIFADGLGDEYDANMMHQDHTACLF